MVFNVQRKVFVSLSVCEVTRQPLSLGDNNCQLLASTSLFSLGSASFFFTSRAQLLHVSCYDKVLLSRASRKATYFSVIVRYFHPLDVPDH